VSRFSRLVIVESCLVPPLKLSLRVLEVRSFDLLRRCNFHDFLEVFLSTSFGDVFLRPSGGPAFHGLLMASLPFTNSISSLVKARFSMPRPDFIFPCLTKARFFDTFWRILINHCSIELCYVATYHPHLS
jgi:hypothetical protein